MRSKGMHEIRVYNTLIGQKEHFLPLVAGQLGLYCCGPTVYNFAHIGNLRTYLFEDIVRRTFAFFGYEISHVMNITDVGHLTDDADDGEDKMLRSAAAQRKSVSEVADYYTTAFFNDCKELNIWHPHTVCKATDHIGDMIALAQRIEEGGYAYISNGNLYFDTAKFSSYGLGGQVVTDQEQLRGRVKQDAAKRNPNDFVLWFTRSKYENHTMLWDSPWGRGYPGWHLECSAMSMRYLGEQFDMHCGGVDHVAVHHTNEIAQVESVTGKQWVRYWVHGEFLLMDEDKISKSKGNFITLSDLSHNGFAPLDLRYLCLGGHYRSQLRFSLDALETARNARMRLVERLVNMVREEPSILHDVNAPALTIDTEALPQSARALVERGCVAIADDFNSPRLLSVVWAIIKEASLPAQQRIGLIDQFDAILGLKIISTVREQLAGSVTQNGVDQTLADDEINALVEQRSEARRKRQWEVADEIRAQLQSAGVTVVDKADGSKWFRL